MSDLDKLLKQLERAGWRVTKTTKGHWRAMSPAGEIPTRVVITSGTPSDRRALANFRAQLKRAGFKPIVGRPRKRPKPAAPPPVAEPAPPPPLAPAPPAEPTELDGDIQALYRLVDHLQVFEQLVGKYRAKLKKLRELEQVLK